MLTNELLHFIKTEPNVQMRFAAEMKTWLRTDTENKLYLYGAGRHLKHVEAFMKSNDIPVEAVLDTHREGYSAGLRIIRYEAFRKQVENPKKCRFVISAPSAFTEIAYVLSKDYFTELFDCNGMEFYASYVPDVEWYRNYLIQYWDQFDLLSDDLSDELSRRTLEMVIRGRISGDASYYKQCSVTDQYYPEDIIQLSPGEIMVELGANNGATLQEFLRRCPNYRAVYCFEPEKRHIPALLKIQEDEARKGGSITVIQKGAWKESGHLRNCRKINRYY